MTQTELFGADTAPRTMTRTKPELTLFVNDDDAEIATHRLARCVYAETLASSLAAVEALCVMIQNTARTDADIGADETVFESLSPKSSRHKDLLVEYDAPGFQMCLRAVRKMRKGLLDDSIFGATKFHRADQMPDWATSIGSIAEVDDLIFYL